MKDKNIYWPCILVEHTDHFSIVSSDFHYFDDYFKGKEAGGYTIEKLARKLIKENGINKEIKFDSEAGMFCAYSSNKEKLLQLCKLFRDIIGEEDQHEPQRDTAPLISLEEAEKLLLKGFVKSLDTQAQTEFLKNVPSPALSKRQAQYLDAIQNGTDDEKIQAAKKIDSEARTKTRNWKNYLSHPNTITLLLNACDNEKNIKVHQEIIGALVSICIRHLPDLRTQKYFIDYLKNKSATNRFLGLLGLGQLYTYPIDVILQLESDRSEKVREEVISMKKSGTTRSFPSWMFNNI
jgi:hypothetical protein